MCGIVGLLLKNVEMRAHLGHYLVPMFACMADRGPDSAGLAVFGDPLPDGALRFSLYASPKSNGWGVFMSAFETEFTAHNTLETVANHAELITDVPPAKVVAWLRKYDPSIHVLSIGKRIEMFKDEGDPRDLAALYHFGELTGSHAIGHTRMATESAVSPAHAHPFTAGEDFCLVHNGSLSNPYMLRRKLEAEGLKFETDNDTEAACRLIEWHMRGCCDVQTALEAALREMDGFYTFLIGTADGMILVRDAYACKPAVVAETADYVAISSEFRSLAHLPGIADADVFEPRPEEIYAWNID